MTIAGLLLAALITPPVVGDPETGKATDLYAQLFLRVGVRDEPSVAKQCANGLEVIRFVEVVDGLPAQWYRVVRRAGVATATLRSTGDGSGNLSAPISDVQWDVVVAEIQQAGFWGASRDRTGWFPDTVTWIFESCVAGKYHNVRYYPDRNLAMRDAVAALSRLLH